MPLIYYLLCTVFVALRFIDCALSNLRITHVVIQHPLSNNAMIKWLKIYKLSLLICFFRNVYIEIHRSCFHITLSMLIILDSLCSNIRNRKWTLWHTKELLNYRGARKILILCVRIWGTIRICRTLQREYAQSKLNADNRFGAIKEVFSLVQKDAKYMEPQNC